MKSRLDRALSASFTYIGLVMGGVLIGFGDWFPGLLAILIALVADVMNRDQ